MGNNQAWRRLGRRVPRERLAPPVAERAPPTGRILLLQTRGRPTLCFLIHQSVLSPPRFSLLYLWRSTLIPGDAQYLPRDFFLFFSFRLCFCFEAPCCWRWTAAIVRALTIMAFRIFQVPRPKVWSRRFLCVARRERIYLEREIY